MKIKGSRHCFGKIRDCFSFALIESAFNLMGENVSAPVMLNRLAHVIECLCDVFAFGEGNQIMAPRNLDQFGNSLLPN